MRATWFSVVAAACLTATPAQAQEPDRHAVFVHGLLSDGSRWSTAANFLSSQLRIDSNPSRPTLDWRQLYESQANNLETAMAAAGYTNAVAISHSNGGIVTREYGRSRGSGSRITGHIAVGSLHQGAALAANVINGSAFVYLNDLKNAVWNPVHFYYLNDHTFKDMMDGNFLEAIFYNTIWDIADDYLTNAIGMIIGQNLIAAVPVLPEMCPENLSCPGTTQFIAGLNLPGNLAAEGSVFPQRISISTEVPPTNVWARGWCPTECPGIPAQVAAYALMEYNHYSSPDQPLALQLGAEMWRNLYNQMMALDWNWLNLIGAIDTTGQILPQDGILTLATQTYVGGTRHYRLQGADIAHGEQPYKSLVIQTISSVLRNDFGIRRRALPTVSVAPSSLGLNVSQSVTLGATVRDYAGNLITDEPPVWASSNNAVAVVVPTTGVVTGVGPGTATITATVEGVSGAATVSVNPPYVEIGGPVYIANKGTYQFPATVLYFGGAPTLTWSERFCFDEAGTSCTAWVSVPNIGTTFTRTLNHDCTGGGNKSFRLHVVATYGSGTAQADHPAWLCLRP